MLADYVKWLKWVGLYLIFMAFGPLLIVLSMIDGDLVIGLLIGLTLYFGFFWKRKGGEKC